MAKSAVLDQRVGRACVPTGGRILCEALEPRRLLNAGQIDPSFGNNGSVGGYNDLFAGGLAHAVVIQHDGRIIAAGSSGDDGTFGPGLTGSSFALARFTTNGSLDPTFGQAGKVTATLGSSIASIEAMGLAPDGKIIAAGFAGTIDKTTGMPFPTSTEHFAVARFNPDGSLDPTFGTNGFTITPIGNNDSAFAMAIQSDGKIVLAGQSGSSPAVARYTASGRLDPSFGTGGVSIITSTGPSSPQFSQVSAIAVQKDGHLLVGSNADDQLVRLTDSGKIDASFGTNGFAQGLFADHLTVGVASIAITPDGKIITGGSGNSPQSNGDQISVARFTSAGKLDHTFGKGGIFMCGLPDPAQPAPPNATRADIATALNGPADGLSMALQRDGRIIVAGYVDASRMFTEQRIALVRLTASGTLDRSFGTGGRVETGTGNLWPTDVNSAEAVALQANGQIVIAGAGVSNDFNQSPLFGPSLSEFLLVRYTRSGKIDPSFGDEGRVGPDPVGFIGDPKTIFTQADGKILVATDQPYGVARFLSDGRLDPTFGHGGRAIDQLDFLDYELLKTTAPTVSTAVSLPDGGLLLGGGETDPAAGTEELWLARFKADGSLDKSFGKHGVVLISLNKNDPNQSVAVQAMAVQPDGKIVAAVSSDSNPGFNLVRLSRSGLLDRSFGSHGIAVTPPFGAATDTAVQVVVQSDGTILLGGTAAPVNAANQSQNTGFVLARYKSNGSLDPTFGTAGEEVTSFPDGGTLQSLNVSPSGQIVAAGLGLGSFDLAHYDAEGHLDPSFGTGGKVSTPVPNVTGGGISVQPDGKFVVSGYILANSTDTACLVRLTSAGALDPSFGVNGILTLDVFDGATPAPVAFQSDGKIIAAAGAQGAGTLVRLLD